MTGSEVIAAVFREFGLENIDADVIDAVALEATQTADSSERSDFHCEGSISFILLLDSQTFNLVLKQNMPQLKLHMANGPENAVGAQLCMGLDIVESIFSGFDDDGDRTIDLSNDNILKNVRSPVKYKLLEECILQCGQGHKTVFTRAQFLCILLKWLGFEPVDQDSKAPADEIQVNEALFDEFEDIGDAADLEAKRTLQVLKNRKASTQEGIFEHITKMQPHTTWLERLWARPYRWLQRLRLPLS